MQKLLRIIIFFLFSTSTQAGFYEDLVKQVADNITKELIGKSENKKASPQSPTERAVSPANEQQKMQVQSIIERMNDSNLSLDERLELYDRKVDYFKAGVVSREFIKKDRISFEKRWSERHYDFVIDEVEVGKYESLNTFAVVRYTATFVVAGRGGYKKGETSVAVLIRDLDVQPKVIAIKEWILSRS